jgi:uncharacterized protein
MVYLDTSVAVSLFTPETTSAAALDWLEHSSEPIIACDWIQTEFSSALAMKHRLGHLTTKERKTTQSEFDRFLNSGVQCAPVSRAMFTHAAQLAGDPNTKLRAGDALHLAAALALNTKAIATFDATLGNNAKALGLKTPLRAPAC